MNTPSSSSVLWEKLRSDRAYRREFAAAQFKRLVPFSIGALRRERQWSQKDLAESSGLTQGVISRAEDMDNGNLTVNTILRIADGFDVAFIGSFVPFSELERLVGKLSDKEFVPAFEQEDAAREKGKNVSINESRHDEKPKKHRNEPIPFDRAMARNEQRSSVIQNAAGTEQSEGGLNASRVCSSR